MKSTQHTLAKSRLACATQRAFSSPKTVSAFVLAGMLACAPALAQQAGGIRGKVTTEQTGTSVEGVTVVASSPVLPRPRTVQTREDGSFNLPLLIPGVGAQGGDAAATVRAGLREGGPIIDGQFSNYLFSAGASADF